MRDSKFLAGVSIRRLFARLEKFFSRQAKEATKEARGQPSAAKNSKAATKRPARVGERAGCATSAKRPKAGASGAKEEARALEWQHCSEGAW
jgi:hypothetical protein